MKRGFVILFVLFCIVFYSFSVSAAIGLSPAIRNVDFTPGLSFSVVYTVQEDYSDMEIEIYAKGDLAEYVSFDKTKLVGGGTFKASIALPEKIDIPGKHRIIIGTREKVSEESLIGTSLTVEAVINVYVPYPGKYLEVSLNTAGDVNLGEDIKFISSINNLGKEDVLADINIDIYSASGEKIETLSIGEKPIKSQERKIYNTILKTTSYKPGPYKAELIVSYGNIARAETGFRIGSLFVNITNYTERLITGKINKFVVGIESQWNSKLDNIYAEINISGLNLSFKSVSAELNPWERKDLEGYVDVGDVLGVYPGIISLYYADIVSKKDIQVEIVKEESKLVLYASLAVVVLVIFVLIYFFFKRSKRQQKKNRGKNVKRKR